MPENVKKKFTEKEYAEYMLANRYLGYTDLALFIAAVLFENFFMKKVKNYKQKYLANKPQYYNFSLSDAIDIYMDKNLCQSDVLKMEKGRLKHQLHLFRRLRNEIAHESVQNFHNKSIYRIKKTQTHPSEDINLDDFFLYVYNSIAEDIKNFNFFKKNPNKTLLQDYKLKEIDERMLSKEESQLNIESKYKNFSGFIAKDFENLFNLRDKMLILQKYLSRSLEDVGLKPTILTPIDTTSAYIWMPFVDMEFIESSSGIIDTERHNLIMGSTSILVTPLDLRIYIDFGGGDLEFRTSYQKFLQSKEFKTYIKRFENIKPSLKIFETRWYSFIVDTKNITDIINLEDFKKQTENALIFLKKAKAENNIITSGRNLLGFILPSDEDLSKEFILERFHDIAHLYYEYLIYKYPSHKRTLREKQKSLLEKHEAKYLNKKEQEFSMDNLNDYNQDYEDIYDDDYHEDPMNSIKF